MLRRVQSNAVRPLRVAAVVQPLTVASLRQLLVQVLTTIWDRARGGCRRPKLVARQQSLIRRAGAASQAAVQLAALVFVLRALE